MVRELLIVPDYMRELQIGHTHTQRDEGLDLPSCFHYLRMLVKMIRDLQPPDAMIGLDNCLTDLVLITICRHPHHHHRQIHSRIMMMRSTLRRK